VRLHTALLGMALVVALTVSGCASTAPGAPATTTFESPPSSIPAEQTLGGGGKKIGAYTVTLFSSPNPPIRGSNTLEALVVDVNNQPVTDATVSFDIDMTNMSHGKNVVAAKSTGNGRYAGTLFFMMPGPWRVIVAVERAGQPAASDRFNFSVNLR
jgi:hypothetical protein